MKFRIRGRNGELLDSHSFLLGANGKIYRENMWSFEENKGATLEILVGKDSLGNNIFENDTLADGYTTYKAGFDMDMGAYLLSNNGGKIPFKQCVGKIVLKEEGQC